MDAITATNLSSKKTSDGSTLNSPPKIIIKKENIGLEEYQHQKYQYSLFNNTEKRDQYYEELSKVKDRLEKTVPSMQQVVQLDMKRVNINKVYERQLSRDLSGPRGLDWQYKQELQRLCSNERKVERDLIRLNRDLGKPSVTTQFGSRSTYRSNSRSQTPRYSFSFDSDSNLPLRSRSQTVGGRPWSLNKNRKTADRFSPISQKSSRTYKPISSQFSGNPYQIRKHTVSMDQEKREVEQKLKKFLR